MPSTGNIFDVAPQGGTGVSGSTEGRTVKAERRPFNVEAKTGVGVFEASPVILSENQASPADSQFQAISQKQRIDAEMRLIFRSSTSTTFDPADDPRFA